MRGGCQKLRDIIYERPLGKYRNIGCSVTRALDEQVFAFEISFNFILLTGEGDDMHKIVKLLSIYLLI